MIPASAWFVDPFLAYFWLFRGLPLSRAILLSFLVKVVFSSYANYGMIYGTWMLTVVAATSWVYGNAFYNKVRYGWLFAVATFLVPPIGIVLYFSLRRTAGYVPKEAVVAPEGTIEFHS